MAAVIKAIPTKYNGITYRSRLEARWAVFFSLVGWQVDYEPNGYVVNGRAYLPDFYVHDGGFFLEVKPFEPLPEEKLKADGLMAASGRPVFIVVGAPSMKTLRPVFDLRAELGLTNGDYRCEVAVEKALAERFDGSPPKRITWDDLHRDAEWRKGRRRN